MQDLNSFSTKPNLRMFKGLIFSMAALIFYAVAQPSAIKLIAKNYNGKTANGLKFSFETFDF